MNLTIKWTLALVGFALISTSCVSKKKFDELMAQKDDLSMKLDDLKSEFESTKEMQAKEIASLQDANESLSSEKSALDAELQKTKSDFEMKLKDLESSIADKQTQIDGLKGDINSAFADLETAVASTDARVNQVENFLYLDFEDDVNFRSGSSYVSSSDKETLESLANMLKNNPKIALMIEGHTDDQKMNADAPYDNNFQLSVARAMSVVNKLVSMGVDPAQLIPAGRGEYMPIADNETAEGREKNRRTEAIVVPNLGKLYQVYKGQK